jgi:hypothetical protein
VQWESFPRDHHSREQTTVSSTSVTRCHLMSVECMCLEIHFNVHHLICNCQALQTKCLGTCEQEGQKTEWGHFRWKVER